MSGKRRSLGETRGVGPRRKAQLRQQDRVPAKGVNAIPLRPNRHWEKVLMSTNKASRVYENNETSRLRSSALLADNCDLTSESDRAHRAVQENDRPRSNIFGHFTFLERVKDSGSERCQRKLGVQHNGDSTSFHDFDGDTVESKTQFNVKRESKLKEEKEKEFKGCTNEVLLCAANLCMGGLLKTEQPVGPQHFSSSRTAQNTNILQKLAAEVKENLVDVGALSGSVDSAGCEAAQRRCRCLPRCFLGPTASKPSFASPIDIPANADRKAAQESDVQQHKAAALTQKSMGQERTNSEELGAYHAFSNKGPHDVSVHKTGGPYSTGVQSYGSEKRQQLGAAEQDEHFADVLQENGASPRPDLQEIIVAPPDESVEKSAAEDDTPNYVNKSNTLSRGEGAAATAVGSSVERHAGEVVVRANDNNACSSKIDEIWHEKGPEKQTKDAALRCRGRRARRRKLLERLRNEATTTQRSCESEVNAANNGRCLRQQTNGLREECAQGADGHSVLPTAVPPLSHSKKGDIINTIEQSLPCYCDDCIAGAADAQVVRQHVNQVECADVHTIVGQSTGACMEIVSSSKTTSNEVGVLLFRLKGNEYVALLDSGASQSFITPHLARVLNAKKKRLKVPLLFSVANGASIKVYDIVQNVQMELEKGTFTGDFLVAPVPYDALIGMDWLKQHKATWDIHRGLLTLYGQEMGLKQGVQIPVKSQLLNGPPVEVKEGAADVVRDPADEAHQAIVQELQRLTPEEAAALVRPSPKRAKGWKNMKKKINIRNLIAQNNNQTNNKAPIITSLCQISVITPDFACNTERHEKQPQQCGEQHNLCTTDCFQLLNKTVPAFKIPTASTKNDVARPFIFNKGQFEVMFLLNQQNHAATSIDFPVRLPNTPQGSRFEFNSIDEVDNEESTWGITPMTHNKFDEWFKTNSTQLPTEIRDVLLEFRSVFPDSLPPGLPPKRYLDHRIILIPGKLPPKAQLYRMSAEHVKAQKQELDSLLERGWIGPTSSPFCAPTMMVSKKQDETGSPQYRMVINYVELNKLTIAPEFPLPNINTILELLGGAKVFTTLDLEAGFNQIRVAKGDRWKTAFRSLLGLYESKVMPFGLKGAPATFQANVNYYLRPFLGRGVIAYLDDILIYSPDVKSHAELLRGVLTILLRERFYPKFSKCKFGLTSLEYLGYRIGGDGISPSEDKVLAIKNWPEVLENDTQVRQFLGTVNYCRMFMGPRFADLARPLVDLTKKDATFQWNEEHTQAVRALKEKLINFTMLQVPDLQKPFVLHTDASSFAVGAVLEQEGKPVGFLSKMMSPTEQRYSVYDQELLALVTALSKWRHLLLAAKVTVYTDHKALTYINRINQNKPARGRLSRWMDFIADFKDLTIMYKEGKCNKVADALSRNAFHSSELAQSPVVMAILGAKGRQKRPRHTDDANNSQPAEDDNRNKPLKQSRLTENGFLLTNNTLNSEESASNQFGTTNITTPTTENTVGEGQEPDPTTKQLEEVDFSVRPFSEASWLAAYDNCKIFSEAYHEALKASPHPVEAILNRQRHPFKLVGHFLYIKLQGLWRICVPSRPEFRSYVLYQHHDHPTAGHMGQKKTYQSLARQYYWPGIHEYCRRYVESCVACRTSKASNLRTGGLLQPLIIPTRRWESVSLDFITSLPVTSNGNDSILVIVDSLSKMAHFVPTNSKISALETVELLADRLVRYHGIPKVLISDRDPRFVSEVYRQMCKRFSIKRAMSSAYHPQSDGQTERVNRTLEQMLRTYIQTNEAEWETLLPAMELAYNCTTHNSVGLSPFEIMIGENPIRAQDLDLIEDLEPMCSPPMTKVFTQLVDRAVGHIMRAKYQQKLYSDTKRRPVEYEVGDEVWLSSKNLPPLAACTKFEKKFRGPFPIVEKIGRVAYKLKLPPSLSCHPVFHVSLLHKDRPREPQMQHVEEDESDEQTADSQMEDFEVEAILNHRDVKGRREYLIKWRGFPVEDATWEPVSHLHNCPKVLRAYLRNVRSDKK